MLIKTNDLKGEQLNYAIAQCVGEGYFSISRGNPDNPGKARVYWTKGEWQRSYRFNPSESASCFNKLGDFTEFLASNLPETCKNIVYSKLGDTVEIPEELIK